MSRTVADVDAEMAALTAAKVHHSSKQMRALREERAALLAPPPTEDHTPLSDFREAVEASSDPMKSDEWRFIEKCLAEIEIANDGNQARLAKTIFQRVTTQVRMWRILRMIFSEVGPGGSLPTWASLGLRDGDGEPEAAKPIAPAPRAPQVVIPAPAASNGGLVVTPEVLAQMVAGAVAKATDPLETMKRGFTGLVGGEVSSRSEPARKPVPASA